MKRAIQCWKINFFFSNIWKLNLLTLFFVSSLASLLLASSAIDLIPDCLVQQGFESRAPASWCPNHQVMWFGFFWFGLVFFVLFSRSARSLSVLERNSLKPVCEIFQFHEISSNQNVLAGYARCWEYLTTSFQGSRQPKITLDFTECLDTQISAIATNAFCHVTFAKNWIPSSLYCCNLHICHLLVCITVPDIVAILERCKTKKMPP